MSMIPPFQTSDFPTIVVLLMQRHSLVSINRTDNRRAVFEFEDSSRLRDVIRALEAGELKVDPVEFWQAERRCKRLLYQNPGPGKGTDTTSMRGYTADGMLHKQSGYVV